MQHRFFDSGAAATALLFKEQLGGLCGKTVLTGGELGVESTNRILVAPVWVALDSPHVTVQGTSRVGVLVFEDLDQHIIADDVTLEDIQYHIYVCQKIERGLKDADAGRVLSQAEVERRMAKWLGQ